MFRPKSVEELCGSSQKSVATALLRQKEEGNLHGTIFLSGDSGSGKTTITRFLFDNNIIEYDCPNTNINDLRNVLKGLTSRGLDGKGEKRVFLDEIHALNKTQQESLLKRIEWVQEDRETYGHVHIVAATTDPKKVITTLRGRFTPYELYPPTLEEMRIWTRDIGLPAYGLEIVNKRVIKDGKDLGSNQLIARAVNDANFNMRELNVSLEKISNGIKIVSETEEVNEKLIQLIRHGDLSKILDNIGDLDGSALTSTAIGLVKYAESALKNGNNDKFYVSVIRYLNNCDFQTYYRGDFLARIIQILDNN